MVSKRFCCFAIKYGNFIPNFCWMNSWTPLHLPVVCFISINSSRRISCSPQLNFSKMHTRLGAFGIMKNLKKAGASLLFSDVSSGDVLHEDGEVLPDRRTCFSMASHIGLQYIVIIPIDHPYIYIIYMQQIYIYIEYTVNTHNNHYITHPSKQKTLARCKVWLLQTSSKRCPFVTLFQGHPFPFFTFLVKVWSGWWFQPLWRIWQSVGSIFPNIWKYTSHVPNHQPVINKA